MGDRSHRVVDVPVGYRVGRWEIVGHIAEGSWGSVYAAVPDERCAPDPADPPAAALKFLPHEALTPGQRGQLAEMTRREVRFGATRRPYLMATLATEVVDDPGRPKVHGATVLVMERAAGSVAGLFAGCRPGEPAPDAVRVATQVLQGLAQIHADGWVHGDLKPSNVLLTGDGTARIADFGLAGELDGTHAYTARLGSIDYLPPEWWTERVGERGVPSRPSRDIWAWGVLAHQLLTGGLFPFAGSTARARASNAQAYAAGHAELRLAESVPTPWRAILSDCLAPTHQARAGHTATALTRRIPAPPGVRPSGNRRRLSTTAVASAVGLAIIVSGDSATRPPPVPTATLSSAAGARVAVIGGALSPDAAVPARYRALITAAGRRCGSREVTAALIAGMIKVASNFDPRFRSSDSDRRGIAGWTSKGFARSAARADGATPSRYSAADSIASLGDFLCSLSARSDLKSVPGDRALVLAAAYQSGVDAVLAAGGVPAAEPGYVGALRRSVQEFTQPLTVRVSGDCVVGRCIETRPVLIRTSGATKGGTLRTIVFAPDGVDRNTSNPGSYRPGSQVNRDGGNLGIWYYEAGDPLGTWTIRVTDQSTGSTAKGTFRVRR